jgi:CRP-like cAMP-binding protein
VRFNAGEYLFREGEEADHFYAVRQCGRARSRSRCSCRTAGR